MTPTIPFMQVQPPPPAAAGGGTPRTLYWRSTQSTVVSAATAVRSLNQTVGAGQMSSGVKLGASTTGASIVVTPGAVGQTTPTLVTAIANKGWIYDTAGATTTGTYAAGSWTFNVQVHESSVTTPTQKCAVTLWKVTATTTAVTSVQSIGRYVSADYTAANNSNLGVRVTWTGALPAITIGAGEYIYMQVDISQTAAGGAASTAQAVHDSETGPSTTASAVFGSIVTSAFA